MPSSTSPPGTSTTSRPAPLLDQVAARYETDPSQVQQAQRGFDELLARRAVRRRAATRELLAELYAQDGEEIAAERLDAEADQACAQERDDRLAAELRRLITPDPAVTRKASTLDDAELDACCQAAVDLLIDAPASLAEFHREVEERHAVDLAVLDGLAKRRAQTAWQLEEARGWQRRRRIRLRRELADLGRVCQAAETRLQLTTARLATIQVREAWRAAWLDAPQVRRVLTQGAAALRELVDRAQDLDSRPTAELPSVAGPQPAAGRSGGRP